jgi:phage tail sheath protein FI
MAETVTLSELVIPGTFIEVRAEGLITVGGVSTGNIGIVGSSTQGVGGTHILSDYEGAKNTFGAYAAGELNLTRALELLYQNGASTVFARALAPDNLGRDAFTAAFNELAKDDVNILIAPQLSTADALAVFGSVLETAENGGKDVMAVVGLDTNAVNTILNPASVPEADRLSVPANDRIIVATPGVLAFDAAAKQNVSLSARFGAAAVAGLISTLAPQSSPTNKVLPGVIKLANRFSYGETKQLVNNRVLVLEERLGVRVVRGITADDAAFRQVTTRRITDFAKAGIRKAADPFIGRLNNQRIRKALRGAIDGFLTTMVIDEALIGYTLDVTATRADEIAGRAIVNAVLQPTFSIDFVVVKLVLE